MNPVLFLKNVELFRCKANGVEYYKVEYITREDDPSMIVSYLLEQSILLYTTSLPIVSDYTSLNELLEPLK
jgi:hypothetical protein